MTREYGIRPARPVEGEVRGAGLRRIGMVLALASAAQGAAALEPDKLFEKASASVFVVRAIAAGTQNYTLGSGVVVAPGKVVTNCHLVESAGRIRVEHGDTTYGATLEFSDPQRDLCQLAAKDLNAPAVALAPASVLHVGLRVFAVGAPQGADLALVDGFVTSFRQSQPDAPQLQVSAPVEAGTAGGGLFDSEGRLVGVTTDNRPSEAPNRIYGMPSEWIRELPERGRANQQKIMQAGAAAAAAGSAHKGAVTIGDTWTYTLIDIQYKPRDRSRKYVHTIRSADEKSMTEQITLNGAMVSEYSYTAQGVGLLRAGTIETSPFLPLLKPMNAGDVLGTALVTGPDLKNYSQVRNPWMLDGGRVIGSETVTVPAGTFDCLKVTFNGRVQSAVLGTMLPNSGSAYKPFSQTVWYAPKAKRAAKVVTSGPGFQDSYELESYSLK
jgi:hypothetical protein